MSATPPKTADLSLLLSIVVDNCKRFLYACRGLKSTRESADNSFEIDVWWEANPWSRSSWTLTLDHSLHKNA